MASFWPWSFLFERSWVDAWATPYMIQNYRRLVVSHVSQAVALGSLAVAVWQASKDVA